MNASTSTLLGALLRFQSLSPEELVTRLASIVDSSEDAIIGRDEHGTINTWNLAATRILGYTLEDIFGQSILILVPPDLHQEEITHLEALRSGERVDHYQTEYVRKGGERVELSVAVSPINDAEGTFIGSALIARDISPQRREHAIRARLASIVESSDDAIVAKDLNGVITDWNAAAERIFGYSKEEMIGRSILTIIPAELQHEEPVILGKIKQGQLLEHYETQRLHKSGRRLDISLSLSPIRDSRGQVIGVSKIARDISDRRRADAARLMLAAIVESSDDAIISKTLDGIITSWNAAAERLFGYTPDEIIGHSVLRLIPRELHHEEPHIISRLKSGERIDHYETRRMRKNGEVFDVSLTVSPINDTKGKVTGASKIVRDISDRKATEAALIEKEKFAAAGRLAGTLAHEVNNPLEAIINLSYVLSTHHSLDEEARGFANQLLKEVQRAGEITRQTLSFYRGPRRASQVNLVEVMEQVLEGNTEKLASKHIVLEKEFGESAQIIGNRGEVRQIFENLIENAIHAMGKRGRIRIRARRYGHPGKGHVVVSICDNGVGIPRRLLPQVFAPFFSTKSERGSGLGLWVALGIVQRHGGTMRVRSSQRLNNHGSVFTVTLPAWPMSSSEDKSRTDYMQTVEA
jgi:PAS domain S-box-containing protein